MANPSFTVEALWDADAQVWYSRSDIIGLHIEADTLEDFEREVRENAPYLVVANHYKDRDIDRTDLRNLIPAIFFRKVGDGHSAA